MRAWRYAASYDARRGTVLTWLLTIVRNVAVDKLRLGAAEPLDPDVLASKLQLHDARTARDEHSAIAEREQLRQALGTLPTEQRRALLLAAYFGLDRRRGGRDRGDTARNRQDADPDSNAPAARVDGGGR